MREPTKVVDHHVGVGTLRPRTCVDPQETINHFVNSAVGIDDRERRCSRGMSDLLHSQISDDELRLSSQTITADSRRHGHITYTYG